MDTSGLPEVDDGVPLEDSFVGGAEKPLKYLDNYYLHEEVMPEGRWNLGAASVVFKAMLRGLYRAEHKRGLQTLMKMGENTNKTQRTLEGHGEWR